MRGCLLIVCVASIAHADPDPLAALLSHTDAIAREVARVRGLPLKKKIANEVLDKDQLRARLVALAGDQKTQGDVRAEGLALARWGMIPPGTDYTKLMLDLLSDQIAGFYDSKAKRLTIAKSAGDDPSWAEMVLAHELDHGLQDQHYDLDRFENLPPSEGDATMARRALVEGDGVALMVEVLLARQQLPAPWSDPSVAAELEQAMGGPSGDLLDTAPIAVREALVFPYRAGFAFVAALRRHQPWSAIDAAFKRPPRSTEQILHPEKYAADERPVAVPLHVSVPGYKEAHVNVWGELGFALFLRSNGIDDEIAAQAAAGWGGDRVVLLANGARTIGVARFSWDTEADAIEAHEAAVRAIDAAVVAGTAEHGESRTRWLALDGTVAFVERRGRSLVIAIGVPLQHAADVETQAWR